IQTSANVVLVASFGELEAAVHRVSSATPVARSTHQQRNFVRLGAAVIDVTRGRVIRGKLSTPLAPCEHALFAALLRRAGESVSRQTLLEEVWSGKHTTTRVVDRQVFLLRQRIEENPRRPRFIKTVFDEGYCLDLAG